MNIFIFIPLIILAQILHIMLQDVTTYFSRIFILITK